MANTFLPDLAGSMTVTEPTAIALIKAVKHSLMVLSLLCVTQALAVEHYDGVVIGGTLVNGTGTPPYDGAIAIRGQQIVAVGDLPPYEAEQVIDASYRALRACGSRLTAQWLRC